jgi:transposase
MQIVSVGIDLGKTTFHLVALGVAGNALLRKKFTQRQLLTYTANMQTSPIGLEACSGAHFLGRALRKQGHDVRLIAAQFVKPFVKSNKNDWHRDNPGDGCTMAAMTQEVARSTPEPKAGFERRFEEILAARGGNRKEAIFRSAALIGGVVLARAVQNERLSEIHKSVRQKVS